ncbi:P-loop NTPase fold protein [Kitasatospora nipponensis]|uniref:P-loop NTPase fold protein n=1 Tax=Kitasatospora nipponensis TaxID=258049 RepID=UPI0031DF59F0
MVRLWELTGPDTLTPLGEPLASHIEVVGSVAWARDRDRLLLATASDDWTVRLWVLTGPDTLTPLGEPLTSHTRPVGSVAWARDGDRLLLATGGWDGTVRLWELTGPDTLTPLGEPLTSHTGRVLSVAWARDGDRLLLATGSDDRTVRLWEVVEDRAVSRLPRYRSDAPEMVDELAPGSEARSLGVVDELDRSQDARALAELITARSARPPLAVGLFGDWGTGKSHFLELLRREVATVARPGNELARQAVRQVRFNAWHYAETSLWTSLVAELFAQLAAPTPEMDAAGAQRSMSRLTADLVDRRRLPERLAAARARHERLQDALRRRDLRRVLSEDQRRELDRLMGEDAAPAALYGRVAGDIAVLRESLLTVRAIVKGSGRQLLLFLVGCTLVLGAGVAVVWVWSWLPRWVAAVPVLVPVLAAAQWDWAKVRETKAKLDEAWKRAHAFVERQRTRIQIAAEVASAEVAELEREMQNLTAAGQLAGMVNERAAAADYRSQLGVMTQIREDFQRMAALLAQASMPTESDAPPPERGPAPGAARTEDVAGDNLPRIDRIVLYIDDLDRCPPDRVVEMLEAIHLLLAVDLFVVVVAIDPRWLLGSIAAHYRDVLDRPGKATDAFDPNDEDAWLSSPSQYLEKIFQVVLTLPALDAGGYQRMLHSLISARPDQKAPEQPAPAASENRPLSPTPTSDRPTRPADDEYEEFYGPRVKAVRAVERVDLLTLDPDELALLDLLGPPLMVTTPRAVKRLANSYGLLTALRRDKREADRTEHDNPGASTVIDATSVEEPTTRPYRAGMVLLAALVAFPALGPALCLHLHRQASETPDQTWTEFCTSLTPQPLDRHWSNAAHPHMTTAQAKQWEALRQALESVTRAAATHTPPLYLPARLGPWREWVVPVARLSFPAGHIVDTILQAISLY